MLDELTIYNLAIKYPNTVDLVREVEKMVRADIIAKSHCEDADCFECAFGSDEKCLLKYE